MDWGNQILSFLASQSPIMLIFWILSCLPLLLLGCQSAFAYPVQDVSHENYHHGQEKAKASKHRGSISQTQILPQVKEVETHGSKDHLLESLLAQTEHRRQEHQSPSPERHDDFQKWMESMFQSRESHESSITTHPSSSPPLLKTNQPQAITTTTFQRQLQVKDGPKESKKWNTPYSEFEQIRIRKQADKMLIQKLGHTNDALRNQLIRDSLSVNQRNHFASGGSIETLPGQVGKGPLDPPYRWNFGLTFAQAAIVRKFSFRLVKGRGASKANRNRLLSQLTRQDITYILENNEVEMQKIIDRLNADHYWKPTPNKNRTQKEVSS